MQAMQRSVLNVAFLFLIAQAVYSYKSNSIQTSVGHSSTLLNDGRPDTCPRQIISEKSPQSTFTLPGKKLKKWATQVMHIEVWVKTDNILFNKLQN